jgi:hypothetical protein
LKNEIIDASLFKKLPIKNQGKNIMAIKKNPKNNCSIQKNISKTAKTKIYSLTF